MLITANICFSEHAYSESNVVKRRISSENRRTVLINMRGASIYGTPARRIEVCTEQPGLIRRLGASMYGTPARRIEVCTEQPGLIRRLGASIYAQSKLV